MIDRQEAHGFADYTFLVVAGDPSANFLQRSSLSAYPVPSAIPGLIGYFQVDAQGAFEFAFAVLDVVADVVVNRFHFLPS